MLRISQEKLAAALGVTFQQVQKYERAANRISASRLYQLCRILKVPISFSSKALKQRAGSLAKQYRLLSSKTHCGGAPRTCIPNVASSRDVRRGVRPTG
jgi:transcriptional regulator with XRE-family HTH domain